MNGVRMISVGKIISFATVALLLASMMAACSDASSSFGRPYRGRSLDVSVVDLQRLPVLQYSNEYGGGSVSHHRVVPSKKGMELVLIRVKVANYTAANHLVTIDRQGAELRDFDQGKYFPLDLETQGQSWSRFDSGWGWADNTNLPVPLNESADPSKPNPPNWDPRDVRKIELSNGGVPPGQGFLTGPFELKQGFGIDGWMVFEAPMGSKFRQLRWQAGDTVTIPL